MADIGTFPLRGEDVHSLRITIRSMSIKSVRGGNAVK